MIQVVIGQTQTDEIEGASKYMILFESGHQRGRMDFSEEGIEILTAAFRAVGIAVHDLTAPPAAGDETTTDV